MNNIDSNDKMYFRFRWEGWIIFNKKMLIPTVKSEAINFLLQIRRFGGDGGVPCDHWYWEDLWVRIIGRFLFRGYNIWWLSPYNTTHCPDC